jgi:SOS-response transcriptional repressor LexA
MKINYILQEVREELGRRGWSYHELARQSGVDYNNVRSWLDQRTLKPQYTVVDPILKSLGMEELPPMAPYMGEVNGGNPAAIADAFAEMQALNQDPEHVVQRPMIRVPHHIKDGFVLSVVGDSMDKEILEGYFVLVDPVVPDHKLIDNEVVIANLFEDDAYTCKMYNHTLRRLEPRSHDAITHKTYTVRDPKNPKCMGQANIVGVVRQIFKNRGI